MEQKQRLIELRISTGMNRREFADYFEIPYRTMQQWELGDRKMPEYLLRLMAYKIRIEKARGIVDDQEDVEEI
ncbi:MAG: transcriptional regulator [Lachnospiraceae bacterium]